MDDKYLHDAAIASLLGISVASLRNKLSAGDPLPPCWSLPGVRARLWRRCDVEHWIHQVGIQKHSGPTDGESG